MTDPFPWEIPTTDQQHEPAPPPDAQGPPSSAVPDVRSSLDLDEVVAILDDLRPHDVRTPLMRQARDSVVAAVRARGDERRKAREERVGDAGVKHTADVRDEAAGAADDAEILGELGDVFRRGADEAKAIAGELLDELPARGSSPRASLKVGDGHGFELSVRRARRTETSVVHGEVDDVLAAWALATADAFAEPKAYAAGVRHGLALLRSVLASSPTYRSTALVALGVDLENAGEVDLAKRLRSAWGKSEKGEPTVTLERKPIPRADDEGATS